MSTSTITSNKAAQESIQPGRIRAGHWGADRLSHGRRPGLSTDLNGHNP